MQCTRYHTAFADIARLTATAPRLADTSEYWYISEALFTLATVLAWSLARFKIRKFVVPNLRFASTRNVSREEPRSEWAEKDQWVRGL